MIQRWTPIPGDPPVASMTPNESGKWVRHEEHVAEMNVLYREVMDLNDCARSCRAELEQAQKRIAELEGRSRVEP